MSGGNRWSEGFEVYTSSIETDDGGREEKVTIRRALLKDDGGR